MDSINQIIVGVAMPELWPWEAANLGAETRIAVRQGFHLASRLGIALKLVTVLDEPAVGFFGSAEDASRQVAAERKNAEELLSHLCTEYAKLHANVATVVTTGAAWLEILKAAEASRRTLIVCGTREQNNFSQLLFGSTGRKLLRNAPGPVWLVKPRIDDDAVMDVLAATDLAEVGVDVIAAGVTLGRAFPVKLTVMHVVDTDLDRVVARTGASEEKIAEWRERERRVAEEQLQDQLSATDIRTLPDGFQVQLAEGTADGCVLSAIEELDTDLLIMASSGRGGIPGVLFGNTAERLLPELPCSLLVVKPREFVCPVKIN
jgi:universal stress protein E